jgi:predicted Abi (CAAX) family protease
VIFFVVPSLDKEIFDDESPFDFVHDWLVTSSKETMGRCTVIRTLDEYVLVFVLVLGFIGDMLFLNIKICLILLTFMGIGWASGLFVYPIYCHITGGFKSWMKLAIFNQE